MPAPPSKRRRVELTLEDRINLIKDSDSQPKPTLVGQRGKVSTRVSEGDSLFGVTAREELPLTNSLCLLCCKVPAHLCCSNQCLNSLTVSNNSGPLAYTVSGKLFGGGGSIHSESVSRGMLQQPCHFYNTTGKCRFGKHCKFAHELGTIQTELHQSKNQDEISVKNRLTDFPDTNPISSLTSSNKSNDESIKEKEKQSVTQSDICRFYATGRFCRFGRRCRFQHVRQQEQHLGNEKVADDLKASQDEGQDQLQDEGKKGAGDESSKAAPDKDTDEGLLGKNEIKNGKRQQRKICKFFKDGKCRFGRRCRFFHPSSESAEPTLVDGLNNLDVSGEKLTTTNVNRGNKDQVQRQARPPQIIKVLKRDEVSNGKLAELHRTEIAQLKRRFPADRLKTVKDENGNEAYVFTFAPTDPDWPFDVKSFEIEVGFTEEYPLKLFSLSLPVDQNLPETVRWCLEKSVREWTEKQQRESDRNGTVELLFRPFLRWLDRNLEDIVTEGLKQLRRELQAQAAGIQFVSAKDLRKDYGEPEREESDEDSRPADPAEDNPKLVVYRKTQDDGEEVYQVPEKIIYTSSDEDDSDDDDDEEEEDSDGNKKPRTDDVVHKRPQINPDTERRGTEMIYRNMQIWYITTLLMEKLHLVVQCERCKAQCDFTTPPGRVNALECGKCNSPMMVAFRPVLTHSYSSTFGYLDMDGCTAFDVVLQDCQFSLGCIACSRDILVKKMTPGRVMELWCRGCHSKMKFAADSVKLRVLDTSAGVDTSQYSGKVHKVSVRKQGRVVRDPAIQEGRPLPDNGACKHYKKSFRWLRFPCCGKAYPCDECHDDKEDHEMTLANRMICGFCCKEQMYAAEKPCQGCSSALTKVKTSHWEGGKGCRDKISMNRGDNKKYSNSNKTVSSKAQALKDKARSKKSAKLSAAKAAQK